MLLKTAQDTAIIENASHSARVAVWVSDTAGDMQLIGDGTNDTPFKIDPVESVDVTWSIDAHGTCTLQLRRSMGLFNYSPLFLGSPNALQSGDAKIDVGRKVQIWSHVLAPDTDTALSAQYQVQIFEGIVDSISPPGEVVTVVCTDTTAVIRDTFIERERMYGLCVGATRGAEVWRYDIGPLAINTVVIPSKGRPNGHWYYVSVAGTPSALEPTWPTGGGSSVVSGTCTFTEGGVTSNVGIPVETLMEQIVADNTDFSRVILPAPLYFPASSGWVIKPYLQSRMSVLKALETFADQIGWRLAMWWDQQDFVGAGDSLWYLRFAVPDRARVTVDKVIPVDHEVDCTELQREIWSIRNAVHVVYGDASSRDPAGLPTRITIVRTDPTSISAYGRRFMEICEDDVSAIDSSIEAGQLADACLADLKEPTVGLSLEAPADPFVEIGDMVQVPADYLRFGADQLLAAQTVRHVFKEGTARLFLTIRGQPVSKRKGWLVLDIRQRGNETHATSLFDGTGFVETTTPVIGGVRLTNTQTATGKVRGTSRAEIHISDTPGFTADASTMKGIDNGDGQPVELVNLVPGKTYYRKTYPFQYNAQRKVRGSPTIETSFVAGRAKAGHYDSASTQSHLPLNGNFEHMTDPSGPPDHWAPATFGAEPAESWGASGTVYFGNDSAKGNFLRLSKGSVNGRGRALSSLFEIRRGIREANLYLSIRRQTASAASGQDLQVIIRGFADAAGATPVFAYTVQLSADAAGPYPTLNTWYEVKSNMAGYATPPIPTNCNFIRLDVQREAAGAGTVVWDIGDVYFQEADFYNMEGDTLLLHQNLTVDGNTVLQALQAQSLTVPMTHVRATRATAQTINSGADTILIFSTQVFDSLNEYDPATGRTTVASAGYYRVEAAVLFEQFAAAVGNIWQIALYKNGSIVSQGARPVAETTLFSYRHVMIADTILLAAGDIIDVRVFQNTGAARTTFAGAVWNYINVHRIL